MNLSKNQIDFLYAILNKKYKNDLFCSSNCDECCLQNKEYDSICLLNSDKVWGRDRDCEIPSVKERVKRLLALHIFKF